jgi:hypothetical protein
MSSYGPTPEVQILMTGIAFPSRRDRTTAVCGSPTGPPKSSSPSISEAGAR